ncbi:MAG: KdsC family phosphatase [Bacteroidia bacterium]
MILDQLSEVKTFIFDVDGVFTTGTVIATDSGEMNRDFNIKDGFAINHAVKNGYTIIIISGGDSEGVRTRLKRLGVKEVHTAIRDKEAHLRSLQERLSIDLQNTVYMGDDLPDIPVMNMCGVKVSPADAVWEVRDSADIVTKSNGGRGAIREIVEKVMVTQDTWKSDDQYVW